MRRLWLVSSIILILSAVAQVYAMPIHVLTTGDTHGWLSGQNDDNAMLGGTAEMLTYWRKVEGYRPEAFLLVSAGDNATGPALSTAFRGDPVIDVMNLMGYDVSAIGNHEFDFTTDKLIEWRGKAKFPFVAANIAYKDGKPVGFALPFAINNEQKVKIAIIGLTTLELPIATNFAKDYLVSPYADCLVNTAAKARAEGAQVIIVTAHVPQEELVKLAGEVTQLNIPLMIGGHSHELAQRKVNNTWVINSGQWWQSYSRIDMDYEPRTGNTTVLSSKQVWLRQTKPTADRAVRTEINKWQKKMDAEYGIQLGYTASGMIRIPTLYNMVTDAYLASDSSADIAVLNIGGLRQDLAPGPVTKGTIFSLMPFSNNLMRLKLSGAQLVAFLDKAGNIAVAGLTKTAGQYTLSKTGKPIDLSVSYILLMPNFIYDTTPELAQIDPAPYIVAADWRTPVYEWLRNNPTSKEKPLEKIVDSEPRIR